MSIAPYGSWKSPISSAAITAGSIRLGGMHSSNSLYWIEGRPQEAGRQVLCQEGKDVSPQDSNIRTRVHGA